MSEFSIDMLEEVNFFINVLNEEGDYSGLTPLDQITEEDKRIIALDILDDDELNSDITETTKWYITHYKKEDNINESSKLSTKVINKLNEAYMYDEIPEEVEKELIHPDGIENATTAVACFSSYDSYQELYDNYEDGKVKEYAREQEAAGVPFEELRKKLYELSKEGLVSACFEKYM